MTSHPVNVPEHLYFVTATVCGWRKLFEEGPFAKIILESLQWLQLNGRMNPYAFVIMLDHLHYICRPIEGYDISTLKQNFGSFTAHAILKELCRQDGHDLLDYFHKRAVEANDGSNHKIWEDIQAKNIYSRDFLLQKLEYVHNNPIQPNWHLVQERWQWKYSSACFYDKGMKPIMPISDIREYLV